MCQDNCKEGNAMIINTDIVIIGSGISALQTAKLLAKKYDVHIVTKNHIKNGSSYKAQGGIAAVTSSEDNIRFHIEDTFVAGLHHHDVENVIKLVKEGKQTVQQLINDHFPIDCAPDGSILLGLEGAHSKPRIIHSGGDATGKALVNFLVDSLPENVIIHEYELAYELLINDDGECIGVKTKSFEDHITYLASYVIVATGGVGALYEYTSNCSDSFGDGIALSYLAGAEIADMEFIQFHPSLIYLDGKTHGLVSEAVRGTGGYFVDENGNRIMERVHPLADLAPRHITAYEMYKHRTNGHEVYIDISNIEYFEEKFPTITNICKVIGIDLSNQRIPIAPGSHFLMGGIVSDAYGRTNIPRLLAIGEAACTGVHGANRLASNSLLECITFGKLMAEHLLNNGSRQNNYTIRKIDNKSSNIPKLMQPSVLQKEMFLKAGIVREKKALTDLIEQLPAYEEFANVNFDALDRRTIEQLFMHITASLIVQGAFTREESRGSHIRNDFPLINEDWQNKWIIFKRGKLHVRDGLYEQNQITRNVETVF